MSKPKKIFKYFSNETHLRNFFTKGEVMFNTLAYFQSCEEDSRKDKTEGANIFYPREGLQITECSTGKKLSIPSALISNVKKPHQVYVFCTSMEHSEDLYKKFGSAGCIEISDITEFEKRIKRSLLKAIYNIKNKYLLSDEITYYDTQNIPSTRHACPDDIVMSKPKYFSVEKEYRFSFSKNSDAFDVNNIDYSISKNLKINNNQSAGKKILIGELSDIARKIKL